MKTGALAMSTRVTLSDILDMITTSLLLQDLAKQREHDEKSLSRQLEVVRYQQHGDGEHAQAQELTIRCQK